MQTLDLVAFWGSRMRIFRWLQVVSAIALVWGGSIAHAEVYRWKDSNGQVHFGDRPDPASQGAKKIVVPRPNLAKSLEVAPKPTPVGTTKAKSDVDTGTSTIPPETAESPKPGPAPKLGIAAQRKDSCQAKWAAYESSAACFGACGKNNGGGKTRNNAGCEHCAEASRPNC